MCGVAGILSREGRPSIAENLSLMTGSLRHRGPDGFGKWVDKKQRCALGHCRLSIIDLSSSGSQPMHSSSERYVLTFNGEIYNYIELRNALLSHGISFKGHSDTEVLLEAIGLWGITEAFTRVVGMFACGVWDSEERRLFLIRDRMGKKPLFYSLQNGALWFASEIKSLKTLNNLKFSVSLEAVSHYLSLTFIPSPMTIFSEVMEVPAATIMTFDQNLNQSQNQYWHYRSESLVPVIADQSEKQLESLLRKSVCQRMRADVPVGVFLSGGLDSGLLTALASETSPTPIKTFSAVFESDAFDEAPMARMVAERYGTDHHEFLLKPELQDLLPVIANAFDEPFADPSAIPTFVISQNAAEHVKVVLNGEGSDELFCGYRRHQAIYLLHIFAVLNSVMPDFVWKKLHDLIPEPKKFRSAYSFLHRFLGGISKAPSDRYLSWGADGFSQEEKIHWFLEDDFANTAEYLDSRFSSLPSRGLMDDFLEIDFVCAMSDGLLTKIDISTMAHGLEGRSPFLDHRLVDWASSLDKSGVTSLIKTKPLIRSLAKKYLPKEIVDAPKRGFEIPLVDWTSGPLNQMIGDLCLSKNGIVLEFFENKHLTSLFEAKDSQNSYKIAKKKWILLMLALWEVHSK